MLRLSFACLTFFALFAGAPAHADLKFCNQTGSNVSVAIGYKDGDTWTSEGWWTAAPGDCTTPVAGDLKLRYYYYRVTSSDIEFRVEDFSFCTSSKAFTIVGDTNCTARGYDSNKFLELDIGEALEWTVNVTANEGADVPGDDGQQALEDEYERVYRAVHSSLQGTWQDATDDAFRMRVQDHRITDTYVGVVAGTGAWSLADTCDGANGAGPVLLVNYDDLPDQTLCWVLIRLDGRDLIFRAVGGSADIHMVKK